MSKSIIYEITTAHPRNDVRIYQKYCQSLSKNFNVRLIVSDDQADEVINENLSIIDIGKKAPFSYFGKYYRVLKLLRREKNKHNSLLHMHDPELMPIAILLGLFRYKVIFDFHEDYIKQLESKPYLNRVQKFILKVIFKPLIYLTAKMSTLTIGVTPQIVSNLSAINKSSLLVENYPILNEKKVNLKKNTKQFVYAGNISEIRGIYEMLDFLAFLKGDFSLALCGKFRNKDLENAARAHPGWEFVDYKGVVDREELNQVFSESVAGLIFFRKVPNNLDSRPNKFYEYMEASLPIIASDIPNWKVFIEECKCGMVLNVDDFSEQDDLSAILSNEEVLLQLGNQGRNFIENNYSWQYKYQDILKRFQSIL